MTEIEKMFENAGIKPEYRYDCKLADTIIPEEIYPLLSCTKGEIKDFCINKQDYLYCKVYKVNKIYPPFTAKKQIKIIQLLSKIRGNIQLCYSDNQYIFVVDFETEKCQWANKYHEKIDKALADMVNVLWQSLTDQEKEEIRGILNE